MEGVEDEEGVTGEYKGWCEGGKGMRWIKEGMRRENAFGYGGG